MNSFNIYTTKGHRVDNFVLFLFIFYFKLDDWCLVTDGIFLLFSKNTLSDQFFFCISDDTRTERGTHVGQNGGLKKSPTAAERSETDGDTKSEYEKGIIDHLRKYPYSRSSIPCVRRGAQATVRISAFFHSLVCMRCTSRQAISRITNTHIHGSLLLSVTKKILSRSSIV